MEDILFESEPPFYRVCVVSIPGLLQVKNQEQCSNGKMCYAHELRYEGSYAFVGDLLQFIPKGLNVSLVLKEAVGSRESDGSFSGCYGSIHDNTSDAAFAFV